MLRRGSVVSTTSSHSGDYSHLVDGDDRLVVSTAPNPAKESAPGKPGSSEESTFDQVPKLLDRLPQLPDPAMVSEVRLADVKRQLAEKANSVARVSVGDLDAHKKELERMITEARSQQERIRDFHENQRGNFITRFFRGLVGKDTRAMNRAHTALDDQIASAQKTLDISIPALQARATSSKTELQAPAVHVNAEPLFAPGEIVHHGWRAVEKPQLDNSQIQERFEGVKDLEGVSLEGLRQMREEVDSALVNRSNVAKNLLWTKDSKYQQMRDAGAQLKERIDAQIKQRMEDTKTRTPSLSPGSAVFTRAALTSGGVVRRDNNDIANRFQTAIEELDGNAYLDQNRLKKMSDADLAAFTPEKQKQLRQHLVDLRNAVTAELAARESKIKAQFPKLASDYKVMVSRSTALLKKINEGIETLDYVAKPLYEHQASGVQGHAADVPKTLVTRPGQELLDARSTEKPGFGNRITNDPRRAAAAHFASMDRAVRSEAPYLFNPELAHPSSIAELDIPAARRYFAAYFGRAHRDHAAEMALNFANTQRSFSPHGDLGNMEESYKRLQETERQVMFSLDHVLPILQARIRAPKLLGPASPEKPLQGTLNELQHNIAAVVGREQSRDDLTPKLESLATQLEQGPLTNLANLEHASAHDIMNTNFLESDRTLQAMDKQIDALVRVRTSGFHNTRIAVGRALESIGLVDPKYAKFMDAANAAKARIAQARAALSAGSFMQRYYFHQRSAVTSMQATPV